MSFEIKEMADDGFKGTYKIWGGERIDGDLGWLEAYDAHGNKIVNNTPYKTDIGTNKPTIRYYRFSMLYNSSTTPSTTSTSSNDNVNTGNSGTGRGTKIGRELSEFASQASKVPMKGYPNVQVRIGYSGDKYEYLGLHYEFGGMGGLYLSGTIGKNISTIEIDERLKWTVSAGYYGGNKNNTVDFGVFFGTGFTKGLDPFKSDGINIFKMEKLELDPSNVTMGFELMYSHWFSFHPRLGLYMIAQGGASLKEMEFNYDFKVGMAYKVSMGERKTQKHTGYPNIQLRAGWFSHKSEFFGLHWEFGGKYSGGYLSGAIGKGLFSDKYDERLNWMAGIGFAIFEKLSTINFGLMVGNGFSSEFNLDQCNMEKIDSHLIAYGMELAYSHWFSFHPQLGVFVIGQGGLGVWEFPDMAFVGGIRVGISYKIFHKRDV